MKNKKRQIKRKTSNRPPGVTEELEMKIRDYVLQNNPTVVDPALAEAAGHNTGFFQVPSELIMGHIERRRKQGANEACIGVELDYLMEYFKQCCDEFSV